MATSRHRSGSQSVARSPGRSEANLGAAAATRGRLAARQSAARRSAAPKSCYFASKQCQSQSPSYRLPGVRISGDQSRTKWRSHGLPRPGPVVCSEAGRDKGGVQGGGVAVAWAWRCRFPSCCSCASPEDTFSVVGFGVGPGVEGHAKERESHKCLWRPGEGGGQLRSVPYGADFCLSFENCPRDLSRYGGAGIFGKGKGFLIFVLTPQVLVMNRIRIHVLPTNRGRITPVPRSQEPLSCAFTHRPCSQPRLGGAGVLH
ncbi:hypothetical protein H8959_015195 [Pygathrix nigripes]